MKRYLTIDEETLKNCLKSASEDWCGFGQDVCENCPVKNSHLCVGKVYDSCWLSIYNWLTEDVPDHGIYAIANEIYQEGYDNGYEDCDSKSYNEGYNTGYEDGWNNGRRNLVKQIEEKAGIIRKERGRK